MTATDVFPQREKNVRYSDRSALNTLEYCLPQPWRSSRRLWIIYIHGGAWQDPEIDASSFGNAQDLLMKSRELEHIAGFASINYRLSPYPSHPRLPSDPSDPARNAHHPDHINDVLAALHYLQDTFHFSHEYLLVGHSCGATLALQVAMSRNWAAHRESTQASQPNVVPPVAILGVEGLYDLPALVENHSDQPVYKDFVANAFGPDEAQWAATSPTSGDYEASWPTGKLVVLAHSREDELVEWDQVDRMHRALRTQGFDEAQGDQRLKLVELSGKHDQVWQEGRELARAIQETVQVIGSSIRGFLL
ncbi:hypothetical protein B0A50_03009 [Salinomyces thailandicus]|uniref:Kynurenine formamidase n=1 Tax=Salinomyces thailandicus TaxID=706561 RepID=A0A4U0U2H4_9PEZI|nr:hypothetical protein B0A50_03009 [Salinomyces thailandica]